MESSHHERRGEATRPSHRQPAGRSIRRPVAVPRSHRALGDADWRRDIALRLARDCTVSIEQATGAVAQWSSSTGAVDPDVLAILRRERGRRTTALLSSATDRLGADLAQLNVLHEVDAVYNSSALGVAKPDSEIFERVCADLGLDAHLCAFVDDTAAHVRAAAALGMQAHRFTDAQGLAAFLQGLP